MYKPVQGFSVADVVKPTIQTPTPPIDLISRVLPENPIQRLCSECASEQLEHSPEERKDVDEMSLAASGIQTKLTVGAPGDVYEQEADRVAAQVMSMPDSSPQVQRLTAENNPVQMWSLAQSTTPVVQRRVDEQVWKSPALQMRPQLRTSSLSQSVIQRAVTTSGGEGDTERHLAVATLAPTLIFGPVGLTITVGVAAGLVITVWLNNGGWEVIGEITNVIHRGLDNTLQELRNILGRAGREAERQVEEIEERVRQIFRAETEANDPNDPERDGSQDRKLSQGEIRQLEDAGYDIHELKDGCPGGPSKCDLYKDRRGNVYVKPKGGRGPGEFTGVNLNQL